MSLIERSLKKKKREREREENIKERKTGEEKNRDREGGLTRKQALEQIGRYLADLSLVNILTRFDCQRRTEKTNNEENANCASHSCSIQRCGKSSRSVEKREINITEQRIMPIGFTSGSSSSLPPSFFSSPPVNSRRRKQPPSS